jgi:EmrB/QacA subfamily drug resistance transporter
MTISRTNQPQWVLFLASIGSLMVALDVTVVATALSSIHQHLHASLGDLEWTVNAYGLSFGVLLMTGSALGDRFGRRRLYVAGLALFALASAACALSTSVGWLIAARAVQGSAAALISPLSLSLVTVAFPPERRGWALGIYGAVTGLAVVSGPVIGGAVTQGIAWQWIFWLNVPIGLAAIPFVLTRIEESYGDRARLDLPGLVLVTAAGLGIVWGLVRGNTAGWGSAEILSTLIGGVVFAALFVAWELRAPSPMLPMRLFRSRAFSAGNAAAFLVSASLFSAVFFMAQFEEIGLRQGALDAGLRLLPWTGTVFWVSPIVGNLIDRLGERPFIIVGLALQGIGLGWIALIARTGLPFPATVAPMMLAGIGVSMGLIAAQSACVGAVDPADVGRAAGTFSTGRQLGAAFGLAVAVALFAGNGSYASPASFTAGVAPALGAAAILSLLGVLAGVALPRRRPAVTGEPEHGVPLAVPVRV